MIKELSLQRFKSWRSIHRMRLAPLTALFGTNSSGKTSVLQWLLVLKQTVESPDRRQVLNFGDDRTSANLGTFSDVSHGHAVDAGIEWSIAWSRSRPLDVANPTRGSSNILFRGSDLKFNCRVSHESRQGLRVEEMVYEFAEAQFWYSRKADGKGYKLSASGADPFRFVRAHGRKWPLPAPTKCYGFPDQVKGFYQNAGFLTDLELAFEELLQRGVSYLGPLRDYPQRQYTWGGGRPEDMGRRGEKVVDALLASRDSGEKISRGKGSKALALEAHTARWLQDLKLIHAFGVEPVTAGSNLYCVRVQRTKTSAPVLITDVGFGLSQILPVIVLCFYAPRGSTVILEQPEIHLHPSVQAGLADVFLDAIKTRGIQVILESHSEHLLRRLQRRIAEEKAKPEECALYFCRLSDGHSVLDPLELDQVGNIVNWPENFFGDEFGEMAEMAKAAARRRRKEAAGE